MLHSLLTLIFFSGWYFKSTSIIVALFTYFEFGGLFHHLWLRPCVRELGWWKPASLTLSIYGSSLNISTSAHNRRPAKLELSQLQKKAERITVFRGSKCQYSKTKNHVIWLIFFLCVFQYKKTNYYEYFKLWNIKTQQIIVNSLYSAFEVVK